MLAVAQDAEVPRDAAVGLQDDPRQDLLAIVEAETPEVERIASPMPQARWSVSRSCAATPRAKYSSSLAMLVVGVPMSRTSG